MLQLIDKRTGQLRDTHPDKIDDLLTKAKGHEEGRSLLSYSERLAWDVYLIEIWSHHPRNGQAKHLFDIVGSKRKNLKSTKSVWPGKPRRPSTQGV